MPQVNVAEANFTLAAEQLKRAETLIQSAIIAQRAGVQWCEAHLAAQGTLETAHVILALEELGLEYSQNVVRNMAGRMNPRDASART